MGYIGYFQNRPKDDTFFGLTENFQNFEFCVFGEIFLKIKNPLIYIANFKSQQQV